MERDDKSPIKMLKNRGFTLVELLIAVVIILILALILFLSVRTLSYRAKKARVFEDLRAIMQAVELYYIDWGHFPITGGSNLVSVMETPFYQEITGGPNATVNTVSHTTTTGEKGGIDYFGAVGLSEVTNPFAQNYESPWNYELNTYRYGSASGKNYVLQAYEWGWHKYIVVYHDTYTGGIPTKTYLGGKFYEVPDWYTIEVPP